MTIVKFFLDRRQRINRLGEWINIKAALLQGCLCATFSDLDIPYSTHSPKSPAAKSSYACFICCSVFNTNGPAATTGSLIGLPAITRTFKSSIASMLISLS